MFRGVPRAKLPVTGGGLTIWTRLLGRRRNWASPPYSTTRTRGPCGRALVAKDAAPDPFRVAEPRRFVPSLKKTEPVGTPAPGDTTLRMPVKVTVAPGKAGLVEEK